MIIDRTGNVGIGQFGAVVGGSPGTSPLAKLHVQGAVRADGGFLSTDTTINPPDYVFEPDYKLMPLPDLQSYVVREKHLPEIPSAQEMKTQGVNLGQLQLQLLKKVEELTLYVIQQDGIVDKQKTVIAELQQTNENQRAAIATLLSRVEAIEHAHAASK